MIRERRFHWTDAAIILVTLGIAGAVAVPSFVSARLSANEEAAVATMHNVFESQVAFKQLCKVDADHDGIGEYAGFVELAGADRGRMATKLSTPLLLDTLARVNYRGEASRIGYRFCIYLPDASESGIPEPADGFTADMVDTDLAENVWCAYAWPMDYPMSGQKTFFIDQRGVVLMTDARGYSGFGKGPPPSAAFRNGQGLGGTLASGGIGTDGHFWQRVE